MRRDRWEMLFALAEDQHAAFTTEQAGHLGVDGHMLARARRDRLIDRVRPRVHAVLALVDEWTPMAALQLALPRAIAARRAAAVLHGFDGVDAVSMDAVVPASSGIRGSTISRVRDLVVPEIVVINGLRCTDEVRTLIDYAAVVDDDHVERAMESVFRRAPEKRALLVDRATALARPGKSGPARALRVESRLPEERTESDLETVYWQALVRHGVPLPERQVAVGRYRVDQAYPDIELFVELDGYAAHGTREAFVKDRHRQNHLVSLGWSPLRFSDSDVRHFAKRTAMQTLAEVTRRRTGLGLRSVV